MTYVRKYASVSEKRSPLNKLIRCELSLKKALLRIM